DPALSGGNLVQNGIHDLDLFCWVLGEAPIRLVARGARLGSAALSTVDHYHVQLTFPGGATAGTSYGYSSVPPDASFRSLYVVGEDGEARYDQSADGTLWTSAGEDHAVLGPPTLYLRELEHWLDCVEGDREPLVRPAQARLALELALLAERS